MRIIIILGQNIKGDCPPLISQMYKHQNKLIAVTVRAFFRYSKIAFSLSELSFTVFVPKYCIAGIFRGYKMFVVFADQASTATHEVNIACMHACCRKAGIPRKLSAKTFLTVILRMFISSKYIWVRFSTSKNEVQTNLFLQYCVIRQIP